MPAAVPKPSSEPIDVGYLRPPATTGVSSGPDGVTLTGTALARAHVRLAPPQGEPVVVRADDKGRWTLLLPSSDKARVYGLSLTSHKRQAQAEGYLLIGPTGQAAVLRAGAGAVRLDLTKPLRLSAVDFDRAGGAVVSGEAPAGAALTVRFDGAEAAQGRANAQGYYSISLPTPAQPGVHEIQVFDGAMSDAAKVTVTQAEPLASGPIRSQLSAEGLRVDWMTPGGGLQSTLLTP